MAVIHVNPYQKTFSQGVAFVGLCTFLTIGLPCLVLYCFFSSVAAIASGEAVLWLPDLFLLLLVAWYVAHSRKNKRIISKLVEEIKSDSFRPLPEDECWELQHNAYLGIDPKAGSLLYVARIDRYGFRPFREVLVMGFDINNMTSFEYRGNRFTINTREPSIPSITFQASNGMAKVFFDKLSIMRRRRYDYPLDTPGYIEYKATRATEEMGLDLILPRP